MSKKISEYFKATIKDQKSSNCVEILEIKVESLPKTKVTKKLEIGIKKSHQIEQAEHFECDYDGKIFKTKGILYCHMKSHLPVVKCHICQKIINFISLNRHLRVVHARDQDFKYNICSKIFKSSEYLKNHEKNHNKKFQCEICKSMHPTQGKLNGHIKVYHTSTEKYKCEKCSKEFKLKTNLKIHEYIHDKNRSKLFKCQRCDYATDTKFKQKNHQKFHAREDKTFALMKNPLKCIKCSKFLQNKKSLNAHLKHVHPNVQFQCDLCGKYIKTKHTLRRHVKIHVQKNLTKQKEV